MKKRNHVVIKFRFYLDGCIMQTECRGVSEVSKEKAVTMAWRKMADNFFNEVLMGKVKCIEVKEVKYEQSE